MLKIGMKNLLLISLILFSMNIFAADRIYIGKFTLTQPKYFSFKKYNNNQVFLKAEAKIYHAEDDEVQTIKTYIPELYIKNYRDVFYKEEKIGRTEKTFSRGWINNELVKFEIIQERRAYHLYMILH